MHDDIVRVFDFGDGPVLEVDFVRLLKDKGRVLNFVNFFRHVCFGEMRGKARWGYAEVPLGALCMMFCV